MPAPGSPNRLAGETSPYLRQHAGNPVDWYPWGDEAFEAARREDKPVFLSIGYSSCHWCHVMARESFEDEEVARALAETAVAVKVDREERPDVDLYYMAACQALTGSGGWPLTLLLTPDRKPFFAATYLPKDERFGRGGLLGLLASVRRAWRERRADVEASAERVAAAAGDAVSAPRAEPGPVPSVREPTRDLLEQAYEWLDGDFDRQYGGFGSAPKFPRPHTLLFLLRVWKRTGRRRALAMVLRTLDAMRRGGIRDQLGSGFHRYSTDERWLLPHFEKMLYDQALLALAYAESFQASGRPEDLRTAVETLDYVVRDLTRPDGLFAASEDADSEGGEGRFYLWTEQEFADALPPEDFDLALRAFGVLARGNFRDPRAPDAGLNVLWGARTAAEVAGAVGCSEETARERLAAIRERLFAARERRPRPARDDKALTDWNGLAVAALARTGAAARTPRFIEAAGRAADALLGTAAADGRILHVAGGTGRPVPGFLDDYAFLIWGLLELYEATFDIERLRWALRLADAAVRELRTPGGAFAFVSASTDIPVRPVEATDGAVPSGNSAMLLNLLRLARLTGDARWEEAAAGVDRAFDEEMKRAPQAATFFLCGVDMALESTEIVLAGRPGDPETEAMTAAARSRYLPAAVILFKPDGEDGERVSELSPFAKDMGSIDGKAAAYVCSRGACQTPVTTPDALLELLDTQVPVPSSR